MRSLGFDLPDEILVDEYAFNVDIYTINEGGQDDDGNPVPPTRTYYVQGAPGDVQPRSGSQRAAQSGTTYESTHLLFLGVSGSWPGDLVAPEDTGVPSDTSWPEDTSAAVLIEAFFKVLADTIPVGAKVDVRSNRSSRIDSYTVVFVANWGTHLEIDLKRA